MIYGEILMTSSNTNNTFEGNMRKNYVSNCLQRTE